MQNDEKKHYQRVLTIAGSDSGGGAGIQADIKAISACGCYAMSVVTALTAQNTQGVFGIHPVPIDFVRQQLEVVLEDIGVDAIKIGMLFSPELIETVANTLDSYNVETIVLDPVMVATSGDRLLLQDAVDALKEKLIPMATILTPNLPEVEVLLDNKITDIKEITKAAQELGKYGAKNILVKGGHLQEGEADDLLWLGTKKQAIFLSAPRISTNNTHGTGCTLSSAIAAGLARSFDIEQAVRFGKEYITKAIKSGARYSIGSQAENIGHGPVNHFFMLEEEK